MYKNILLAQGLHVLDTTVLVWNLRGFLLNFGNITT